ncbi:response regulator transcription factor [Deinococcus hohokamensis]|uniref:Response regulator transcription factor n=1 Tax=Deinococcus hohokamensis TaxID=309883 RepID=A0ABV9IDZ2_9DEIO
MRLLLIEDDARLAELITRGLRESGQLVEHAASAREGRELARSLPFDALIVDVGLPEGDEAGFALAQALRDEGQGVPILFLTARTDVESRLRGLDVGGDDYLGKPFDFRELRARLTALVRRSTGRSDNRVPLPGGASLDLNARTVRDAGGQPVLLTARELGLLETLALHPDRAYTRDELLERVWAGQLDIESRVVDVYIGNLRRKLGEGSVVTLRGHGYRLGTLDSP